MKKSIIVLTLSLLVGACASFPRDDIEVTAEIDPRVNLSGYASYEWLGSLAVFNDPYGTWQPVGFDMDSEIAFLIDRELRKLGIEETVSNAELLVAYLGGIDMDALQEKLDPDSGTFTLENIPQGGLTIALIDAESGFVVWVANATAEIRNLPSEQVKKRLDYAVTRMFKQIPR